MSWDAVYRLVKKIPGARVMTYGETGSCAPVCAVEREPPVTQMAACPAGRGIPWHRVVGAGGRLLIREPHAGLQARLLAAEGIEVNGRTIDLQRHKWTAQKKEIGGP